MHWDYYVVIWNKDTRIWVPYCCEPLAFFITSSCICAIWPEEVSTSRHLWKRWYYFWLQLLCFLLNYMKRDRKDENPFGLIFSLFLERFPINNWKKEKTYPYNTARVLALYKSYWAAINKIFIYARPCVNKMTWVLFGKFPVVCLLQLHRARQRKHYFEQSKPLITSGLWLLQHFLVKLEFIWLWFSPFSL